jgi:uncharacterized membrane protein YoaK (UPF0700 family)
MPLNYLSQLTDKPRTGQANLHMGVLLAVVAGALNAGGFLAVGQYTSHMTGMVSTFADQLVLQNLELAVVALVSWIAFLVGAATTAVLVNHSERQGIQNIYARPLLIEAACVLVFGSFGGTLQTHEFADVSLAVIILCFAMGLQNALITKISKAVIRTTHVTGLTTDLGIELGKLLYWNRKGSAASTDAVVANREKMRVHAVLIAAFLLGGFSGALGFKYLGFVSTVPLAIVLGAIALAPTLRSRRV